MDSARNLSRVGAEVCKTQFGLGNWMEFTNRPLRFVGDFPGKQGWVSAKLPEKWNQNILKEGLSTSGKVENVLVGVGGPFPSVLLKPKKIDEGKA